MNDEFEQRSRQIEQMRSNSEEKIANLKKSQDKMKEMLHISPPKDQ